MCPRQIQSSDSYLSLTHGGGKVSHPMKINQLVSIIHLKCLKFDIAKGNDQHAVLIVFLVCAVDLIGQESAFRLHC